MTVLVSVVIPTRNRLAMLAQTLHTVLAQAVDLEVIVVDEASTDGTAKWLAAHTDPRVSTIRNERPLGPAGARNAGGSASDGRWLAFVDDDDLWLPDKLVSQLGAAAAEGSSWAYGGALDITSEPRLLRVTIPSAADIARIPWANVVPGGGSNVLVERSAFQAVGGFDTSLPPVEDWELWIRLWQLAPPAVVERPVLAYRMHGGNASKRFEEMLEGIREIERRYYHLRGAAPLDWEDAYRWIGAAALRSGDRATARRVAFEAMRSRHRGATRRLVRSLVPLPPRQPVPSADDMHPLRARVRPPPIVPWPPTMHEWARKVLTVELR